jgi:glucose-1-phosphate thymidylyltransferase
MLGVIAAGGKGTRLLPVTKFINKHLVPVRDGKLMIDYPLHMMRELGFSIITIVTGCEHAGQISEHVQDGEAYGFSRINYEVQPAPAGIADVIKRVGHLVDEEGMLLILGDNYFSHVQKKPTSFSFACAWEYSLGNVAKAKSFGQIIQKNGKQEIIEKPVAPEHDRVLVGLYYFPADVVAHVQQLSPSARQELEITDLLSSYLKKDRLALESVQGAWSDLGEWDSWQTFIAERC